MNELLIHADPGARSGFVAAWLQDNLEQAGFDVGETVINYFTKIHDLDNQEQLTNFHGTKIRIKSTFNLLDLHLLLFLRKNVHVQVPEFTRDEFSLETFSKVYIFAKEIFASEKQLDYTLYDYVISFDDTFDLDKLIDLYYQVNNRYPTDQQIALAVRNNTINQLQLDPNHACSIASMVLETESTMNLLEENRFWSIPVLYSTTATENLYQVIKSNIVPENYQNN